MRGTIAATFALIAIWAAPSAGETFPVNDTLLPPPSLRNDNAFFTKFDTNLLFVALQLVGDEDEPLDYSNFKLGPVPRIKGAEDWEVCTSVISLNSLYKGVARFRTNHDGLRVGDYVLTSNYKPSDLQAYNSGNTIFRSIFTEDCDRPRRGVLIAAGVAKRPTHLRALIGLDEGALKLFLANGGDIAGEFMCVRMGQGFSGFACTISLADVEPGDYDLTAHIQSAILGKMLKRSVRTAVPAAP